MQLPHSFHVLTKNINTQQFLCSRMLSAWTCEEKLDHVFLMISQCDTMCGMVSCSLINHVELVDYRTIPCMIYGIADNLRDSLTDDPLT